MEEGTLAKWLKAEGDAVAPGDVISEIEPDKATMEIEAVDEGILGKIVVAEGTEGVKVNTVIAHLLEDGEDAGSIATASSGSNGTTSSSDAAPDEAFAQQESAPAKATPAPAKPAVAAAPDPDLPEGTAMVDLTVREALRDAMAEEMRRDERVFLMGEEVAQYQGAYKVSQGLLEEFGDKRVVDTPITEHGFAGVGVGAAYRGLRPIVEFMTFNFAMQAIDHLINSAAKTLYMTGGAMPVPIVFRGPNGAAARVAAQHSQNFAAWYASVPGLKVVAPYSAADAKGLLKAAIRDPNPVIFLENEILYGASQPVPNLDDYVLPIGKARIARPGADVTIVAYSISVRDALKAADQLAEEGIEAEVIDLRTLRPLDTATIVESVRKTNRIVAVEEGWPVCGICSEIAAVLMEQAFDDLDAPMLRVTGEDVPMPYAANLEALALPNPAKIVQAVKTVCYRD